MGTSRSGHEMGSKIVAVGLAINRSSRDAVGRAALAAKEAQLAELDRVTTNRTLRGVGRQGARLGVRYDVKGTKNPTALVQATGRAWPIIEGDTKPHEISPRASRHRKSATGATTLMLSDGVFRAKVQHPGTKGKHPWAKGQLRAIPAVTIVLAKQITSAVASVFR